MNAVDTETRKKRILIIEDDESVRQVLSFRLVKSGFEVMEAQDGFEGLDDARRLRPDLILLDLRLPGRPGEEICKAIREDQDEEFAKTPILMLTGKASDVDRVIGMVIGANAYVPKPFRVPVLMREINRCLESKIGSTRRAP
jgi:DNA-binding response OmpR family regulator